MAQEALETDLEPRKKRSKPTHGRQESDKITETATGSPEG
jgi:hypothetical protein